MFTDAGHDLTLNWMIFLSTTLRGKWGRSEISLLIGLVDTGQMRCRSTDGWKQNANHLNSILESLSEKKQIFLNLLTRLSSALFKRHTSETSSTQS